MRMCHRPCHTTVTSHTCTMLLHTTLHWPKQANISLCPMALIYTIYIVQYYTPAQNWSFTTWSIHQKWTIDTINSSYTYKGMSCISGLLSNLVVHFGMASSYAAQWFQEINLHYWIQIDFKIIYVLLCVPWNWMTNKLSTRLWSHGFQPSEIDPCLFLAPGIICVIYIDDCLFFAKDTAWMMQQ